MTTPEHVPTEEEILAVQTAAAEAEAEAHRLESAIENGDLSVELDDIEAAARAGRKERLRAKGLRALRQRALARRRQEQLADYRRLIVERFGEHEGDVLGAFDEAVSATDRLISKVVEHNDGFHEIRDALIALVSDDDGDEFGEIRQGAQQIHLPRADVFLSPLSVDGLVAEAVRRALMERGQSTRSIAGGSVTRLAEHHRNERDVYQLDVGDLLGESDRLRRTARLVAQRGTGTEEAA